MPLTIVGLIKGVKKLVNWSGQVYITALVVDCLINDYCVFAPKGGVLMVRSGARAASAWACERHLLLLVMLRFGSWEKLG